MPICNDVLVPFGASRRPRARRRTFIPGAIRTKTAIDKAAANRFASAAKQKGSPLKVIRSRGPNMLDASEDFPAPGPAELPLARLIRELRAISSCNQTLMRAVDEQALLDDICRIVCEEAGYRMAWVGFAEHDEAKTVRPVASAGFEDGYVDRATVTWADTERGRGPVGTAIRTERT